MGVGLSLTILLLTWQEITVHASGAHDQWQFCYGSGLSIITVHIVRQHYITIPQLLLDIPHFKQVVVMATNCEYCGYRSNEVKSGSGVSEHGTRIKLRLTDPSDLSRDILKVT